MSIPIEPANEIIELRQTLRRKALVARDDLSSGLRHDWSEMIRNRLQAHIVENHARFIHCYRNFRSEVETKEFIQDALHEGIRVVVPVVERIDSPAPPEIHERLAHTEIKGGTKFVKGRFGIEEPALRAPSSLEMLDAVIIPVVAFDRCGTRLGYGKGFYDVFLKEIPRTVERIGLAFSVQEIEHIPVLLHDEPLDCIITEREIITIII